MAGGAFTGCSAVAAGLGALDALLAVRVAEGVIGADHTLPTSLVAPVSRDAGAVVGVGGAGRACLILAAGLAVVAIRSRVRGFRALDTHVLVVHGWGLLVAHVIWLGLLVVDAMLWWLLISMAGRGHVLAFVQALQLGLCITSIRLVVWGVARRAGT